MYAISDKVALMGKQEGGFFSRFTTDRSVDSVYTIQMDDMPFSHEGGQYYSTLDTRTLLNGCTAQYKVNKPHSGLPGLRVCPLSPIFLLVN